MKWLQLVIASLCGFALEACMPWPSQITPAVTGSVIDASTESPISGASVHIEEFPEKTATTSGNGQFSIKAIRKWEVLTPFDFARDARPAYRLIATAQGFQEGSKVWYIGDDRPQMIKLRSSGAAQSAAIKSENEIIVLARQLTLRYCGDHEQVIDGYFKTRCDFIASPTSDGWLVSGHPIYEDSRGAQSIVEGGDVVLYYSPAGMLLRHQGAAF